jgi:hypothetical protein
MTSAAQTSEKFEISQLDLYEQVWSTPANRLADKFGVSGSYLARVCDALKVPRPPVGYWQKLAVGKAKPRPDLPLALPGDQVTWSKDKALATPIKRMAQPSSVKAITAEAKPERASRHPLLQGVEGHFRKTRKLDEGEFLKPYKQLLPDIVTSETCLAQALGLANEIYNALDRKGHRIQFAPPDRQMHRPHIEERQSPGKDRKYGQYSMGRIWSPHRSTITYLGSIPVGLALTEMTERVTLRRIGNKYLREDSKEIRSAKAWQLANSWTTEQDLPCGRFRLVAYSPLHGVEWLHSWQETAKASLGGMIPDFLKKLENSQDEIQRLMTAADEAAARRQREWEEQQERWRMEEDQRRIKQADAESRKQLSDIMDRWATAVAVQRFFDEAEERASLVGEERHVRIMQRLALARAMLGPSDPLDYLEEWLAPEERYRPKYEGG